MALEVRNLTRYGSFEDVSFTAKKGEILGFSGLVGAGRTEVFRCVFGVDPPDSGEIYVNGRKAHIRGTRDAIRTGDGVRIGRPQRPGTGAGGVGVPQFIPGESEKVCKRTC